MRSAGDERGGDRVGGRGATGNGLVAAVAEGKVEGNRATAKLIGANVVGQPLGSGIAVIIGGDVRQRGSSINGRRSRLEVEVGVSGVDELGVSSEVVGEEGVSAAIAQVLGIVVGDVVPHLSVGDPRSDQDPPVASISLLTIDRIVIQFHPG